MIIVIPFFAGDRHLAVEMAAWLNELGTYPNHDLLIVRDHRAAPVPDLGKGFRSVEELVIKDDAYNRWPQSCNVMWQTAAKHIARTKKQPWLWLEVDAVLLKASGLDEIALEYEMALKAGKWFLGDYVNVTGVAPHCSGVAVYPWDIFEHAGEALLAHELAWDSVGAAQILPQMQRSELIQHVWKGEPFATWDDVQRRIFDVKPRACMYHADKSGSLYKLLGEQQNGIPTKEGAPDAASEGVLEANPIGVSNQSVKIGTQTATEPALSMTCDLFIKTYPKDYSWLEWCLRSVGRFAVGFPELKLLYPVGNEPHEKRLVFALDGNSQTTGQGTAIEYVPVEEYKTSGYLSQMIFKLYADEFTDAENIVFIDSDTIFTRPVSPEMFFTGGKLNWMISPYSTVETPWQDGTEKFLAAPVEFETMRRFPVTVPRWLLAEVRHFCFHTHGIGLSEYVMAQEPPNPAFSEFNILGAYAYAFHRERFNWIDTSTVPKNEWPPLVVLQKYSHSGLTPEIEAEFETILSGGTEGRATCAKVSEGLGSTPDSPADTAEVRPEKSHSENQASPAQASFDPAVPEGDRTVIAIQNPKIGDRFEIQSGGIIALIPLVDQTPWANRAESIAEINRLVARLKEFQGASSAKVRFVRELLHRQGVIELHYRFKKRRKLRRKTPAKFLTRRMKKEKAG